jgi:hypothetical protein
MILKKAKNIHAIEKHTKKFKISSFSMIFSFGARVKCWPQNELRKKISQTENSQSGPRHRHKNIIETAPYPFPLCADCAPLELVVSAALLYRKEELRVRGGVKL